MRIKYTKNCTKVYDSYLIDNVNNVAGEILITRIEKGLLVTRTMKSYAREIKAHNRLYKLGLFRSHTKDTDLEENIKKWKEIIFEIIGR